MKNTFIDLFNYVESSPFLKTLMMSILLFIFFFLLKKLLILNVINMKRAKGRPKEERIFFIKRVSQYINYVFLILLFVLWFAQLQVVFVSLIAVAAAMVLAFKELIMCVIGGVYIRSLNLFKEGHRIEVKDIRGFVIERLFLSTKILEIGPESNSQQTTGDVIGIPNSLFLVNAVKNESYFKGFSIKTFQFKLKITEDVNGLEGILLENSNEICSGYLEEAKNSISKFCANEGIIIPSVEPRTKVLIDGEDKAIILVKLVVKNTQIADVEQKLNRLVLSWKQSFVQATTSSS